MKLSHEQKDFITFIGGLVVGVVLPMAWYICNQDWEAFILVVTGVGLLVWNNFRTSRVTESLEEIRSSDDTQLFAAAIKYGIKTRQWKDRHKRREKKRPRDEVQKELEEKKSERILHWTKWKQAVFVVGLLCIYPIAWLWDQVHPGPRPIPLGDFLSVEFNDCYYYSLASLPQRPQNTPDLEVLEKELALDHVVFGKPVVHLTVTNSHPTNKAVLSHAMVQFDDDAYTWLLLTDPNPLLGSPSSSWTCPPNQEKELVGVPTEGMFSIRTDDGWKQSWTFDLKAREAFEKIGIARPPEEFWAKVTLFFESGDGESVRLVSDKFFVNKRKQRDYSPTDGPWAK